MRKDFAISGASNRLRRNKIDSVGWDDVTVALQKMSVPHRLGVNDDTSSRHKDNLL